MSRFCGTGNVNRRRGRGESRNAIYAAIHVRWKQQRPDLHHSSAEEISDELHRFVEQELRLPGGSVESLKTLSNQQLCTCLDALRGLVPRAVASGFGSNVVSIASRRKPERGQAHLPDAQTGVVVHLASKEQVWAVERILDYLGWGEDGRRAFIKDKFKRASHPAHLTPAQCHSLIRILLNVAASRDLKRAAPEKKVSRAAINAYLTELKAKLGIGSLK